MKITKRQLRRIIKEEKAKLLREDWKEDLPPPGADRKPSTSTDAAILVEDYIQGAVFDGLEEMGVTAEQADEIIRQLYNRPDMVIKACVDGLYDYKEKLAKHGGKPKPRSV
mgnify:CR=1 FL=1